MPPQLATALTIGSNVLIDALVADGRFAGDLHGAPLLRRQPRFHGSPLLRLDPSLRARCMPTLRALPLCGPRAILGRLARVASKLAADRRRRTFQLRADFASRKTAPMQVLNLIAFVLAQVCVAHVQFHLAVKRRRLPHLRRSTALGGALQN
jgi:hypothetical protein